MEKPTETKVREVIERSARDECDHNAKAGRPRVPQEKIERLWKETRINHEKRRSRR